MAQFYRFYEPSIWQQAVAKLENSKKVYDHPLAAGEFNPIGISEFNLTEILPEELKSSLPTLKR